MRGCWKLRSELGFRKRVAIVVRQKPIIIVVIFVTSIELNLLKTLENRERRDDIGPHLDWHCTLSDLKDQMYIVGMKKIQIGMIK